MINEFFVRKKNIDGSDFLDENGDFVNEVIYSEIVDEIFTIEQLKKMQYDELQPTDWYFVRKVELGIEVPIEIINERLSIRAKYDLLKLEI